MNSLYHVDEDVIYAHIHSDFISIRNINDNTSLSSLGFLLIGSSAITKRNLEQKEFIWVTLPKGRISNVPASWWQGLMLSL